MKQMRRHERATLNHAVTLELVFQTPSAGGKKFHQSMKRGRLYTWQWQTVARRTGGWSETGGRTEGVWFMNLDRGKMARWISSHLW